jgi:RNA polymerase-binding transcription factor DksA
MATKKPTPQKKGKVKPIKNARPAAKKTPKAAPKKAAVKKAAPAAKKTVKKAVTKKPMPKNAPKHAPKKAETKKPVAKAAPVKALKKVEPKKPEPKAKPAPVAAKPVVAAKAAAKPVAKPPAKKEPPKPVKVVIPKTTTKTVKKYEPDFTKSVLDSAEHIINSGPTMRYSDSDLKEFREIITKKLDAAKKELNYLQGLITRKDESGEMEDARYMTMEDGSVSMEREQLSQMASRQIQFIDHLEKAMMRIENKTYGICRITGKLIDKARLRAVPHATLSIEAKQMMNK